MEGTATGDVDESVRRAAGVGESCCRMGTFARPAFCFSDLSELKTGWAKVPILQRYFAFGRGQFSATLAVKLSMRPSRFTYLEAW